jgi:hypothetical protein
MNEDYYDSEMGGACGTNGKDKCVLFSGTPEGKRHFEDLGVDGRII